MPEDSLLYKALHTSKVKNNNNHNSKYCSFKHVSTVNSCLVNLSEFIYVLGQHV